MAFFIFNSKSHDSSRFTGSRSWFCVLLSMSGASTNPLNASLRRTDAPAICMIVMTPLGAGAGATRSSRRRACASTSARAHPAACTPGDRPGSDSGWQVAHALSAHHGSSQVAHALSAHHGRTFELRRPSSASTPKDPGVSASLEEDTGASRIIAAPLAGGRRPRTACGRTGSGPQARPQVVNAEGTGLAASCRS